MEDINRVKVVLVEKKRTSKRLAEQMGGKSYNRFQMVYELFPARLGNYIERLQGY